jgi:hypothetical protein
VALTSKSPRDVLIAAMHVARRTLAAYRHEFSPKKFTQHQLFACLVLKNFLKTDYRGVVKHLKDCPALCEAIELKSVPHFTTLQKASRHLLASRRAQRLLDATVKQHLRRKRRVPSAAVDSTGMQCGCASAYFAQRRRYGKNPGKKWSAIAIPSLAWSVTPMTISSTPFRRPEGRGPMWTNLNPSSDKPNSV